MTTREPTNAEILLGSEVRDYLAAHPEVVEYLSRVARAQEVFGKFVRLAGSRKIVRDLAGASTSEVELDGSLSGTNR